MPKVSVVIPTFNRADTIGDSIKSVLEQTFKDFEVIVVDDGSTDGTESVVAAFGDSRIKYIMQDDAGACAARNNGIRHANGEYIAFQDSDDYWMPRKLERQLQNISLHDSKIDICKMHSAGLPKDEYEPCRQAIEANFSYEYLLGRNFVSTQMILARHELFEDNLFDVKIPRFQDWDLMLRLLRDYKLSYTDEVLVERYISADSISQNVHKALEAYSLIEKKYSDELSSHRDSYSLFMYTKAQICKSGLTRYEEAALFMNSFKMNPNLKSLVRAIQSLISL